MAENCLPDLSSFTLGEHQEANTLDPTRPARDEEEPPVLASSPSDTSQPVTCCGIINLTNRWRGSINSAQRAVTTDDAANSDTTVKYEPEVAEPASAIDERTVITQVRI